MKYETRLIWLLAITFGFLFFDRNAVNYLMPFIADDLHFNNQQVGLVASALSFTWAVSAFLGGAIPTVPAPQDHTAGHDGRLLAVLIHLRACGLVRTAVPGADADGPVEGPFLPIAQSLVALESRPERAATTWA